MNEYIKKCLESPNHYGLSKILENKNLLKEALNEKDFINAIYSPYRTKLGCDTLCITTIKTLKELPDKFLHLPPEHFVNSVMTMTRGSWRTLPSKVREKVLARFLSALDLIIASKSPSFNINLVQSNFDSFLWKLKQNLSDKIILKLSKCCKLTLPAESLRVLKFLHHEAFKEVISNSIIDCYLRNGDNEIFHTLSSEYRQIFLRSIVVGRVKHFGPILASRKVGKKFLDQNASALVTNFSNDLEDLWGAEKIFEAKSSLFRRQSSPFALLLAIKFLERAKWVRDFSEHLAKEDLKEYAKHLKPTQKRAWTNLLLNPAIKECPVLLKRAVKCYSNLKYRLYLSSPIEIPDAVIIDLTPKQLSQLVEKEIDEKGSFCSLRCNPELIAQLLTSVALTDPSLYREKIVDKITLAIDRYKKGETIYDKICKYLEIDDKTPYSLLYNEDNLEKLIRKAVSAETIDKRHAYVFFIISLLQRRKFSEAQAKYRNLLK